MPKHPWEGVPSEQPAEVSETQTEVEKSGELKTAIKAAHDMLYTMAHSERYYFRDEPKPLGFKANADPTVADVIQRTRKAIEDEKGAQEHWGSRAKAEADMPDSEKKRYWVFHPGKGPTAQENVELAQRIQGSQEALLARLADVPPERKMKDVVQEWEQEAQEQTQK